MGLREALWALVLALLLYGGWQFLRALRAARGARPARGAAPGARKAEARSPARATPTDAAGEEGDEEGDEDGGFDYAPELRPGPAAMPTAAVPASPSPTPSPSSSVSPPAPASASDGFQLEVENRRLRRELAALQGVIERQHDEIDALNLELHSLREQLEQVTAVHASASPEYAEALVLAEQGMTAEEIAARCGITVAEAELVLSLSDSRGPRS